MVLKIPLKKTARCTALKLSWIQSIRFADQLVTALSGRVDFDSIIDGKSVCWVAWIDGGERMADIDGVVVILWDEGDERRSAYGSLS